MAKYNLDEQIIYNDCRIVKVIGIAPYCGEGVVILGCKNGPIDNYDRQNEYDKLFGPSLKLSKYYNDFKYKTDFYDYVNNLKKI